MKYSALTFITQRYVSRCQRHSKYSRSIPTKKRHAGQSKLYFQQIKPFLVAVEIYIMRTFPYVDILTIITKKSFEFNVEQCIHKKSFKIALEVVQEKFSNVTHIGIFECKHRTKAKNVVISIVCFF